MDILDKFISQAKENVSSGYYEKLSAPAYSGAQGKMPKRISLRNTLASRDFSIIAEIKHASPAGEYSFDNIDVEKTAFGFKSAGADAISVVVEPKIFKGSLSNIPIAKKTGLPVLFKDFVLDARQVKAAAASGADAMLLVVKVATRLGLDMDEYISLAHSYGLEVLLECYDSKEMEAALRTKADMLGINNRDLQTLKVDLNRTKEIFDAFAGTGLLDRPLVSESGLKTKADSQFIKKCGAKAILVGTALWKAENQQDKIRELKGVV